MKGFMEFINKLYASPKFDWYAYVIIAILVLAAYSNTFTASFHFDDNPAVIENYSIRYVTMENIFNILQGNRPVVDLSLMLNYQLNSVNVIGYHVFNIGCHIANSILVFTLIIWTLNVPLFGDRYRGSARWMALFGALLFGLHPVQTESVTYIISRSELLATFFYLATFLLFIKGVQKKNIGYYAAAIVSAAMSMGSKQWAITLPALLVLYDYLFLSEGHVRPIVSRAAVYGMICITWIIVLRNLNLFAAGGVSGVGFSVSSVTGLTPMNYFLTSLNVIWTYVRLMLLPINQNLDYDYKIAKNLFELPTIISFFGHLAVVGGAFWLYLKKKSPLIPFGAAWFYIGLSPTQSIVPIIDVIFEHRLYMPSIGFVLVFVVAYEMICRWLEERRGVPQSPAS
jgi:hypothetical protein